jgi:hypothetical protein
MSKRRLVKKIQKFQEMVNYKWEIKPNHRAWFILSSGKIYSGETHRGILKRDFSEDWNLIKKGEEDAESFRIEEILEHRLLKTGAIKIGEIKDHFYVDLQNLERLELDLLQGFAQSICDSSSVNRLKCQVSVFIRGLKKNIRLDGGLTLEDLIKDKLWGRFGEKMPPCRYMKV